MQQAFTRLDRQPCDVQQRAAVDALIDEMHGAGETVMPFGQGAHRPEQAGEGWQGGGVDIDDAVLDLHQHG